MNDLTQEEAEELLVSRKDQGLGELYAYLKEFGPFAGTTEELAVALSAATQREYTGLDVRMLFAEMRSPGFGEAHGWTINYVGHGNQHPVYQIIDGDEVNADATHGGVEVRSRDMLNLIARLLAQGEFFVAQTDGRRPEGKLARFLTNQCRAMRDSAELLVEQLHSGART